MSQFVELAHKFQEQQIQLVKQSQEAFLKAVETMISAVPATPEVEVPDQVKEAFAPAYDFFGTPDEVQAFLAESTKTWTKIAQDFQNRVVAEVTKNA
jgi:hypothetical protein